MKKLDLPTVIDRDWAKAVLDGARNDIRGIDAMLKTARAARDDAERQNNTRQQHRAQVIMRLAAFADGQDISDAEYIRLRAESDLLGIRCQQSADAYASAVAQVNELEQRRERALRHARIGAIADIRDAAYRAEELIEQTINQL